MTAATVRPVAPATGRGPVGRHVLSMRQFRAGELAELFALADRIAAGPRAYGRLLAGRVMMSAFFECSTRTRLSFETAMLRLGGSVSGFADPSTTRAGGSTQESDDDVARMLSLYADVVVIRHPVTGWPARAARLSGEALVVNGGDGTGEHPTQTLVDLYTLWRRFGRLDGLRILLTNDLRMRCVHSLLLGLREFDCTVHAVTGSRSGPVAQPDGAHPVTPCDDAADVLGEVDAVYSSPTVAAGAPDTAPPATVLHRAMLERHAGPRTVVLHPLPRGPELAVDVDGTRFNGYWDQARNAVPLRMALLASMFGSLGDDAGVIPSPRTSPAEPR